MVATILYYPTKNQIINISPFVVYYIVRVKAETNIGVILNHWK